MPGLVVVSGAFGKGAATYDRETLALPGGHTRPVETIASIDVHGGVAGQERESWATDIVRSLKGGLSLASNLELTGATALAAGALTSGLSILDEGGPDSPRALLDITFDDGASVVALAHPALAALLLHDRGVVMRTVERLRHVVQEKAEGSSQGGASLLESAQTATSVLTEKAGSVLSSAFDLIRREKKA